eukprot:3287902-Amphidinium_carterae.1
MTYRGGLPFKRPSLDQNGSSNRNLHALQLEPVSAGHNGYGAQKQALYYPQTYQICICNVETIPKGCQYDFENSEGKASMSESCRANKDRVA